MFKTLLKNPKTSVFGLAPIISTLVYSYIPAQYHPIVSTGVEFAMGVGLLLAKDAD